MARYDIDLVKSAADGRWKDILASIGNVDSAILMGRIMHAPSSVIQTPVAKIVFALSMILTKLVGALQSVFFHKEPQRLRCVAVVDW
jgi:hypothetical protein